MRIDSFEQLREATEAAGNNLKKPLRVLVFIAMITMIQLRKAYSTDTEDRYFECMKAGDVFPAIKGIYDLSASKIFGFDGEHRLNSTKRNGQTHILMELTPGTERDAILNAAGVNDAHGLGRTDEDKRNAVLALLADSEWQRWSSTKLAKISRTSVPFVEGLRQEGEEVLGTSKDGSGKTTKRKVERNGKVYEMTIPTRQHKDPVQVALAKIVKLVDAFDPEERQRLIVAVMDKLKDGETAA